MINEGPWQLCRSADAVGKTKGGGVGFPWWTHPLPIPLLIAKGLFVSQLTELILWFPFLPACLIGAQDKEVRRMKGGGLTPRARLVADLEGRGRLIVKLYHFRVMFHQVDCAQLDLTLELDGDAHLAGRKEARHIPSASLCAACWWRKANARNHINGFGRQMQGLAPTLEFCRIHRFSSSAVCRSLPTGEKVGDSVPGKGLAP